MHLSKVIFRVSILLPTIGKVIIPPMRTIKLTHPQFREWRLNELAGPENPIGARDRIRKELLERNGGLSYRLMSPMGRFIGTVRGENSSPATGGYSQNGAPSPDSCVCKAYAGTPEGKHHPVCQHRAAWEAGQQPVTIAAQAPASNLNPAMNVMQQRVAPQLDTSPKVQHMSVPKQVSPHAIPVGVTNKPVPSQSLPAMAVPAAPVPVVQVPAVVALIPPEQCDCRHFAKPAGSDPKQHHFVCEHFEKWKISHPTPEAEPTRDTEKPPATEMAINRDEIDYVLVDLDSRRILRDATSDEVASAQAEEAKNGSPLVTLDEGVYAVVERPAPEAAAQ